MKRKIYYLLPHKKSNGGGSEGELTKGKQIKDYLVYFIILIIKILPIVVRVVKQ